MLLTFWLFERSFTAVVTVTFTALILAELLNVYTALTSLTLLVLLCQFATLVVYVASIVLLRRTIDVSVIDVEFAKNVLIIVMASWLPLQLVKMLRVRFDPT